MTKTIMIILLSLQTILMVVGLIVKADMQIPAICYLVTLLSKNVCDYFEEKRK